jgi:outer membrane protein assembly factor BamB
MKRSLLVIVAALAACGADWPQWRGPHRDGVSTEPGLLKEWPEGGPKLLWTINSAGEGYSSPAVVGDRLYLAGGRGDTEFVVALDLSASPPKELWAVSMGPKYVQKGNKWNTGPSAAPAVDGGLVVAQSGNGELVCVEAATGAKKWQKSLPKDLGGEVNPIGGSPDNRGWGFACSPLVDGDNVICVPGGAQGMLAALNKKTGEVVWRSKGLPDQATYASPVKAEIGGVAQYVQMTNEGVAGVAAKDGALLWYYKRERPYADIVAFTPIVRDGLVFVSAAGSGGGTDVVKVTKDGDRLTAEKAADNRRFANFHGGAVLVGDQVYGASGDFGRSNWACLDFKSAKILWSKEEREVGKGSIAAADGRLYVLGEKDGQVRLLEASPKAYAVKGAFPLPNDSRVRLESGQFWTHPVIANGRLYLRNQEFLYCYDVKGK